MKVVSPLALAALVLSAASLPAQTVVQPDRKLTEQETVVRTSLYQLRDSLNAVEAASARIARDLQSASDAALRSRARVMAARCRAATSQLDSSRAVVGRGNVPAPDPKQQRGALDKALVQLRSTLTGCGTEFTGLTAPEKAQELRGYGIGRGQKVQAAIQDYRAVASLYFRAAFDQQYWPDTRGAGQTPTDPKIH